MFISKIANNWIFFKFCLVQNEKQMKKNFNWLIVNVVNVNNIKNCKI